MVIQKYLDSKMQTFQIYSVIMSKCEKGHLFTGGKNTEALISDMLVTCYNAR